MENFSSRLGGISAKSSEISPRRAGSLLIWTHYIFIRVSLRKVRSHLGEKARLTEPAHLHMNSPLISFVIKGLLERKTKLLLNPNWHYMLKVNNRNIRARYEIYSKARRKTTEQYYWRRSGALTVNFKHVLHFVLLIWLLWSNKITRTVKTKLYSNKESHWL